VSGSKVPRQTAAVCAVAAIVAFLALLAVGQPWAGISLGVGIALGGINGLLAARTHEMGGAFRFLSLARIGMLSALALVVGVLLQPATAWVGLFGLAASQFLMSALAAREVLRR
jgi:hypothetical protein